MDQVLADCRGEPVVWILRDARCRQSRRSRASFARRSPGRWLVLDLRPTDDDPKAALAAWRELMLANQTGAQVTGVVVDDLGDASFDALHTRIAALAASLKRGGGRVLITSNHSPSPARLAALGATTGAALQAPYFTIGELIELIVELGNGPEERLRSGWAHLVSIATAGGHPLMAAGKIASLRGRGWPADALMEDFGTGPSEEIGDPR